MASFHTIICQRGCALKHHDLVLALQGTLGPETEAKWKSVQRNDEVFRRCVDRLVENNWKKNSDLPESLDRLRYPLVHVCCLLGKPEALDFLINSRDFDPAVQCSRTGETALHAALRYYYDIYFNHPRSQLESLTPGELRKGNNECIAIFEKLLRILTSSTDRILHVKDSISRVTVFHLAAVKRTEASKELQVFRTSNVFKVEQKDSTEESILMYEISFYDQCLRLLASKLDENAGLEVLRFDTNRRGQTVVDILAADPCGSALETLQFFADRFPALNTVLQKKFRIQTEPAEPTDVESPTAGTSRETCDDQEMQEFPHHHSEPQASSSPELTCPPDAGRQDSQLGGSQRVDLHDTVIVKIEHDQEEPNICSGTPRLIHHSGSPCSQQSATQSSLRELLVQRGMVSSNTTKNSLHGSLCAAANNSALSKKPGPSRGAYNAQTKCSAAVLSPFLELVIKEGIELDETTHNSIMTAIKQRCSQKLSEIDSKLSALNEQSLANEKEINERFFVVQKKKAQMDKVRNEIIAINRQIVTLKNEVERKVEMGKIIQLEVRQLEQDLNKTKEFGGALELKRKQLSEEQRQVEEKLSLCEGRKEDSTNGHPHKKPKI